MPVIADCVRNPRLLGNTRTTVVHAAAEGFKEACVSLLYVPPSSPHEAELFGCPPDCEEYLLLSTTDYTKWYGEFVVLRNFPRPVLALELFSVPGIDRFWAFIDCPEESREMAVALLREKCQVPSVAVFADGAAPFRDGCADVTGAAEFVYCPTPASAAKASLRRNLKRAISHGVDYPTEFNINVEW